MTTLERIITTSQCDPTDFVSIMPVEIKGRDFPLEQQEVVEILRDKEVHCVRTTLDYRCHAWCVFSVVDGGDLLVHRLAVKNQDALEQVINNLFETMTTSPKNQPCKVTIGWPEHGTDHWLFNHLIDSGWTVAGLDPDEFEAYGETWDAIRLEKTW